LQMQAFLRYMQGLLFIKGLDFFKFQF